MNSGDELREKFMEFLFVSDPHRDLMVELVASGSDPRSDPVFSRVKLSIFGIQTPLHRPLSTSDPASLRPRTEMSR